MTSKSKVRSKKPERAPRHSVSAHDSVQPFVFVNMAMTADGKIASANRVVSSFGSERDHEHLIELRTTADAVMAGARTVDLNPVNMGPGPSRFRRLRVKNGLSEYNLRVIVSGSGTVDPDAEIFRHRFSPIILLTTERTPARTLRDLRSLADEVKICGSTELDFDVALRWLRQKWNVKRLLCEGGGKLNAALFSSDLVDELHLTICPKIMGGEMAPTIADGIGAIGLANAIPMELYSFRRSGDELFLIYRVHQPRNPRHRRDLRA